MKDFLEIKSYHYEKPEEGDNSEEYRNICERLQVKSDKYKEILKAEFNDLKEKNDKKNKLNEVLGECFDSINDWSNDFLIPPPVDSPSFINYCFYLKTYHENTKELTITAFALATQKFEEKDVTKATIYLHVMYVSPEYRKQGRSIKLLNEIGKLGKVATCPISQEFAHIFDKYQKSLSN